MRDTATRPKDPTSHLIFAAVAFGVGLLLTIALTAAGIPPGFGVLAIACSLIWGVIGLVCLARVHRWVTENQKRS